MMSAPHRCIDVHTHVVPEDFPSYVGRGVNVAWPSMRDAAPCHRHVMLNDKIYRTVPHTCWDTGARITGMEQQGVDTHVLSPMPELLSYWLDADDGATMSRYLNERIAAMVSSAPTHFCGLAAVPLQDVDRAIVELEYAVNSLNLSGAEIGTNVNGVPLGDVRFDAFFAAAESLGAALFVHPLRPAGKERLVGPANLEQIVAFPGETGLAAASLVTGGMLQRHPRLRIALSHGGGTLASLLPRLQHGWDTFAELRDTMPESPTALARRMYYDSLVYDTQALAHVVASFGATQVCVGSDFPFKISEKQPVARIDALQLDDATRRMLLHENAERWLNLTEHSRSPSP